MAARRTRFRVGIGLNREAPGSGTGKIDRHPAGRGRSEER